VAALKLALGDPKASDRLAALCAAEAGRGAALEQLMQERVGLKVAIRQKENAGGGSVRIFFDNTDELSSLLKRIGSAGSPARIDL
jgi:hypothetical protein